MVQMTSMFDFNPAKISVLDPTQEEREEIDAQIAAGLLPRDYWILRATATALNVFGHDAVKDRRGNYVEQGIGSPGHETRGHFEAIKKNEQRGLEEPGTHARMLAQIWKDHPERAKAIGLQPPAR
jgi:hypothetical protein